MLCGVKVRYEADDTEEDWPFEELYTHLVHLIEVDYYER